MRDEIADFIQSAIKAHGYHGAVIGISGGIDSAVVGALTVMALGRKRVMGLLLPERDSAPETLRDSQMVCDFLGIERIVKPISAALRKLGVYRLHPSSFLIPRKIQEAYVRKRIARYGEEDIYLKDLRNAGDPDFCRGMAYYRAKHRLRMVCLYLEAEQRNYAVVGTTNRTEAATGFYVKWGDDSADIEPIIHLYKTQVFELAGKLGVPDRIQTKAPSPDLLPGLTDEQMLGMNYRELDTVLIKMDQGLDLSGLESRKVARVRQIFEAAKKRNLKNLAYMPNQNINVKQ